MVFLYTPLVKEGRVSQLVTSERKQIVMRGFQMLVIGIMMNIGITVTGFLAFVQVL